MHTAEPATTHTTYALLHAVARNLGGTHWHLYVRPGLSPLGHLWDERGVDVEIEPGEGNSATLTVYSHGLAAASIPVAPGPNLADRLTAIMRDVVIPAHILDCPVHQAVANLRAALPGQVGPERWQNHSVEVTVMLPGGGRAVVLLSLVGAAAHASADIRHTPLAQAESIARAFRPGEPFIVMVDDTISGAAAQRLAQAIPDLSEVGCESGPGADPEDYDAPTYTTELATTHHDITLTLSPDAADAPETRVRMDLRCAPAERTIAALAAAH